MTANWRDQVDAVTLDPHALRAPGRVKATARRFARRELTIGPARDVVAELEPGAHVFAVTRGQFSMIDIVLALLERCGAGAAVTLWTWCIADYETESLHRLIDAGEIGEFRLLIDAAGARMDRPVIQEFQRRYGDDCVRVTKTHAKLAIVRGGGLAFLARGSMNLNANPRIEQCDISEGDGPVGLVEAVVAELWGKVGALPIRYVTNRTAVSLFEHMAPEAAPAWSEGLTTLNV